jgi:peptidoglycan/xylan/chitin deacetylase (PgdA/CDA1 family)
VSCEAHLRGVRLSNRKLTIITTSWDDGDVLDLRIAEELSARRMSGTFYVPLRCDGRRLLSSSQLRGMSPPWAEIGAHTVSHPKLTDLPAQEIAHEIGTCKQILEDRIGKEVRMFCYPFGRYDRRAVQCVAESGYAGARGTQLLSTTTNFNRFEMPVTLQAFPTAASGYMRNALRRFSVQSVGRYMFGISRCRDWVAASKMLLDRVVAEGGVWHLFGHSWEIEQMNQWSALREVLDYAAGRDNAVYATNGEVIDLLSEQRRAPAIARAG